MKRRGRKKQPQSTKAELAAMARKYEPKARRGRGPRPGVSREKRLVEQMKIAALVGTGMPVRKAAATIGLGKSAVQYVKARMKEDTATGELLRKAAAEARQMVAGEAMDVLRMAIAKAKVQLTKGVKGKGGYAEPPLAHVAQAVRSLGDVAMFEPQAGMTPSEQHPADRVNMSASAMADLLLKVRDHEQAKGRAEIDVTPAKELNP